MDFKRKHYLVTIGSAVGALGISFGIVTTLINIQTINKYVDYFSDTAGYSYESYDNNGKPTTTHWNMITDQTDPTNHFNYPNQPLDQQDISAKKQFTRQIIDGSTHDILDRSFNQSAFQGMVNWSNAHDSYDEPDPNNSDSSEWYNSEIKIDGNPATYGNYSKPTSDTPVGFENAYNAAIASGNHLLTLPGFLHASPLYDFMVNQTNKFNSAGYIFIDFDASYFQGNTTDNIPQNPNANHIASLTFRADQSAFFAGLATCQYLNDNWSDYWRPDHQLSIGTFGGQAIPTVTSYMGGFELAAYVFNSAIELNAQTPTNYYKTDPNSDMYYKKHQVQVINLGKPASWFSNSFSIGDGRLLAQTLLAMGADAIMAVAGPQTIDTVQEIKSQHSKTIVIGVDTAQENSDVNATSVFIDRTGNNKIIKFSAVKNISYMVSAISWLASTNQESLPTNDSANPVIGSFGYLTVGDIDNEGASSSFASYSYLGNFFNEIDNTFQFSWTWANIVDAIQGHQITDPASHQDVPWNEFVDNHMWFKC